ncbi:MAG: RluA family pseudouridine synthase [Candidatus Omnitrophica bacterium]|nr:RluA family pseudouridine synthase [Candidatus Omnitrophota bacterium]
MQKREIRVGEIEGGERLDAFLARKLYRDYSRTRLKELIQEGHVLVNDKQVKAHYAVHSGDRVQFELLEREAMDAREENIPLSILFEDEDLLVVDKPAGMVVHPAYGNLEHTLVNALLYHTRRNLSLLGGSGRAGIVHRLDKDTSGVLVVAKNDVSHRFLAKQFKDHSIHRVYDAFVKGVVQHNELKCEEPVGRAFVNRKKVVVKPSGGKSSLTFFKVKERFRQATWIQALPHTGRTHQIRVHLSYLGHPVLGDALYGGGSPLIPRHALHARTLEFTHPRSKKRVSFSSELPEDMKQLLIALRK